MVFQFISKKIMNNNNMPKVFYVFAIFLCISTINATKKTSIQSKILSIISSSETHSMNDECGCSMGPVGGFPKRAQIINSIRKKNDVLLLDAGGFSGGGLYDFYTEGRIRDSLRTIITIRSMAAMGYDVAAIGDEELQYGGKWLESQAKDAGLTLVSANCKYKNEKPVSNLYVLVKKNNLTIGITAVTSRERLFYVDQNVVVGDPIKSIQNIWKKLKKKSDIQIILSHLGEDKTIELANAFPECKIIVNGHRKITVAPVYKNKKQLIMQFGFQGKKLSQIDYYYETKLLKPYANQWLAIEDDIDDDPAIAKTIEQFNMNDYPKKIVHDLFIMSQCPYGLHALGNMMKYYETFPKTELSVWFVGDVNTKEKPHLKSLHGEAEINDEKLWLAIKACYPQMWDNFLHLRAIDLETATMDIIHELELDTAILSRWIDENGTCVLEGHYLRSQRQQVEASPTLLVNNRMAEHEISFFRMAKNICDDKSNKDLPGICDSLPECFEDGNCYSKGKIGKCKRAGEAVGGTCVYSDAVIFDFIAVVPDSPVVHTEQDILRTTKTLFPGVQVKVIPSSSKQGKTLIKEFEVDHIPFYMFEKKVETSQNFDKIKTGIISSNDWYIFKPGIILKHYFPHRKKVPQQLTVFLDPLLKDLEKVLVIIEKYYPDLNNIKIHPVIFTDQVTAEEKIRQEEAIRWKILQTEYSRKIFHKYLRMYREKPGSSYWFSILKKLNIEVDSFVKKVEEKGDIIKNLSDEIEFFGILEPVGLLFENREFIKIQNQSHMKNILKKTALISSGN